MTLPNALNLLFGKLLLARAALSIRFLKDDLFESFGATDGHALRLGSLCSAMKIHVRLDRMILKHSICVCDKRVEKKGRKRGLNCRSDQTAEHMATYKVVYNACYGGFDLSAEGLSEYNRRASTRHRYPDEIKHDDPILIEMVETMSPSFLNSKNSLLKIKEFPIAFRAFLAWNEYDGKESVRIDYHRYIVHTVHSILESDQSAEEKIGRVAALYADLERVRCRECNDYKCMHAEPVR